MSPGRIAMIETESYYRFANNLRCSGLDIMLAHLGYFECVADSLSLNSLSGARILMLRFMCALLPYCMLCHLSRNLQGFIAAEGCRWGGLPPVPLTHFAQRQQVSRAPSPRRSYADAGDLVAWNVPDEPSASSALCMRHTTAAAEYSSGPCPNTFHS